MATKRPAAKKSATRRAAAAKKTAAKTTKRAPARRAASVSVEVPASRIRAVAKDAGVRVSSEFFDAFNQEVTRLLQRAVERAKGNGRATLRPQDL